MNGAGLTLLVFVGVVMVFGLTYAHEQTHIQIYKAYGVSSELTWNLNSAEVTAQNQDLVKLSESDRKTVRALQSVNEIVSYQYMTIFAMQFFILIMVILNNERRPNIK